MVLEVRDLWPEVPIAMGILRNPILRALARSLEWAAYRGSSEIVALSPGMKAGVVRRGIPAQRVTVIPNGCDLEEFAVDAAAGDWVREALPAEKRRWPLVLYTGAFGTVNGLSYLVEVAAHCQRAQAAVGFLLVGDGRERELIIERARALGVLGANLWVWEPVEKRRVADLLAAASLCVSTVIPVKALEDNSANKFFDALAAGRAVAVNHEGWLADLLREGGAGIVLPGHDTAVAAREIALLVGDAVRLAHAGQQARRLAETRFSRDMLFDQFERALLRAAGQLVGHGSA
jgi:glycosyltransferase involved in cell wall biosynthesis